MLASFFNRPHEWISQQLSLMSNEAESAQDLRRRRGEDTSTGDRTFRRRRGEDTSTGGRTSVRFRNASSAFRWTPRPASATETAHSVPCFAWMPSGAQTRRSRASSGAAAPSPSR